MRKPEIKIKTDLFFLAVLAALWAAFHYRVLLLKHTFVLMDCSNFFYPLWKWGGQVIREGVIPLWNPDAGFGTPYLADPETAVWYLPKVLFYLCLNATSAFTLLILFHHFFAVAGFWVWARGRGFSRPASFLGSVAFGFSFNCVCLTYAPSMVFTFSWIPWVFWAAGWFWKNKTTGSFLLLSSALTMQFTAGYPVFAFITWLALGLEWLFMAWETGKKGPWMQLAGLLARPVPALALACLFAAVWVLPFLEMKPYSNIAQRLEMADALGWGSLATWFNPFYLGHPLYSHPEVPHFVSVYFLGLPMAVLVLWGLIRKKTHWISGVLFCLILVLSLGENMSLGGWLKAFFPGYSWMARSGYWIPLVVFLAVRVGMEAAEKTIWKPAGDNQNRAAWLALCLGTYGAALLLGVPWDLPSFWISLGFLVLAGSGMNLPVSWRWIFCVLALLFSLAPVVQGIHFTLEKSYYDQKADVCGKLDKPGRIYHSPQFVDRFRTVSAKSVSEAYDKIKQALIPNWPLVYGLEETAYSNPVFLSAYLRWNDLPVRVGLENRGKFLQYLNAGYVIERPESGDVSWQVFEIPGILPKWFSVAKADPAGDWPSDLEKYRKADFSFSEKCLVADGTQTGEYVQRVVREEERTPNRIRLFAEGTGKALLVSSELAYPGWVLRTGAYFRPLLTVNHDFRGLILQPDEKHAEVAYRPTSFRLGMFLSLLAIATWAGLIVLLLHRPRKGI